MYHNDTDEGGIPNFDEIIIVNYAVTTASTHDSQIDLSIPGITVYGDRG